jgi:hypothetical protein
MKAWQFRMLDKIRLDGNMQEGLGNDLSLFF